MKRWRTVMVAAALAVGGCAEPSSSGAIPDALTVRDSTGVTIVENHDSAWTAETRWRLADAPDLVIGSVDGSVPGTDWGQVGDVVTVGDRIVIEASRQDEIRFFDAATGEFDRVVGGTGEGPTEFGIISRVDRLDDNTIAAVEANTGKVVEFAVDDSSRPEVWSTGNPTLDGYWAGTVQGWLPNGDHLLMYRPDIQRIEDGVAVLNARWQHVDREGRVVRELPPLPSTRAYRKPGGFLGIVTPGVGPVGRVRGSRFWHAFPESWELTRVDLSTGSIDGIVRRPYEAQPTPEAFIQGVRDFMMDQARSAPPEARDFAVRNAEAVIFAETWPAFKTFLVSPEGFVWVNEELDPTPGENEDPIDVVRRISPRWTVLDPEGRWLGTIEMPEGIEVKEVGVDYVLGVREDDLGVPFVERYRILRPE